MNDTTGKIFQYIHEKAFMDEGFKYRNTKRYSLSEFGFDTIEDFNCCVFGCGAGGSEILNLLELGAKFVHGIDLIDEYIPLTEKQLKKYKGKYKLTVGDIINHPYDDNQFDFVTCNGVIHHIDKDFEALRKIANTVKKGGYAYIEVVGKGGIADELIKGTLRKYYANDEKFKKMIDSLSVEKIKSSISWLKQEIQDDKSDAYKKCIDILENVSSLIDNDIIQCILDRLQAPIYKGYTQNEFEAMLLDAGFKSWKRITRTPHYRNIRKLAVPFYADPDHIFSKFLYNDGQLSMLCKK